MRKWIVKTVDEIGRMFVIGVVWLGVTAMPARALDVQSVVSPSGIEAWLVEDHSNPIISMNFAFTGGASVDPAGKEGLAYPLLPEARPPVAGQLELGCESSCLKRRRGQLSERCRES